MSKHINSLDDVIQTFGGGAKFSRALNVAKETVVTIKWRKRLPYHFHLPVYLALKEIGYTIDDKAVFGYVIDDIKNKLIAGRENEKS